MVSVQKWPELNKTELVTYYNEIKANKILKLEWTNPGKIDPKLYYSVKNEKNSNAESFDENSKESTTNSSKPLDNVITSSTIDINKFDLFDDDDEDLDTKKPSFNLRLIHSNTRSRSSDNRVACMDKILNDMRKNYETEQKQIVSNETMMLVNDNFCDELNNKSNNELEPESLPFAIETVSSTSNDHEAVKEDKMETEILAEQEKSVINQEETSKIETKSLKEIEEIKIQHKDEPIETDTQQIQENKETDKLDYIETSTPYPPPQSVNNECDMPLNEDLNEKKDETNINTPLDQIDSIKSNRDYSSNELSDTTEEIETFTRKEPITNRIIESVTSAFNLTTTVQSLEKSDDQIKEVDSTTYKSQSPSPTREEPIYSEPAVSTNTISDLKENVITINETKSNLVLTTKTDDISTTVLDEETEAATTTTVLEDDPLISQDISEASNNANESSQLESNV